MRGWVQGTRVKAGVAVLAAVGAAGMIAGWSLRPAEKSDSASDSASVPVQVGAEGDPRSDAQGSIVSTLMFSAQPTYMLTSDAIFGYVHADVSEPPRALDGRASSQALTNPQREGSGPR